MAMRTGRHLTPFLLALYGTGAATIWYVLLKALQ